MGLGPDLGLKFGPSPNRKSSNIRPPKNTDVQWSAKILTSAARCRAQHVTLKFTVIQEKYHYLPDTSYCVEVDKTASHDEVFAWCGAIGDGRVSYCACHADYFF